MYIDDTIAAIATPPGIGGVGIIRVSGKDSFPIVNSLFKSAGTVPLMDRQNRTIQYGTIVDPATNKTLDEVLVLLMKGPHPTRRKMWWKFSVTAVLCRFDKF